MDGIVWRSEACGTYKPANAKTDMSAKRWRFEMLSLLSSGRGITAMVQSVAILMPALTNLSEHKLATYRGGLFPFHRRLTRQLHD